MIFVTGALTNKAIGIPTANIAIALEFTRDQLDTDLKYPKKFTRIFLKTPVDKIKYADCLESVEEVVTQLNL